MTHPTVVLSNGLRVANFSSPHSFNFVDGSVLPACAPEHARAMMLDADEVESRVVKGSVEIIDIELRWSLNDTVYEALCTANELDVDIILVPLPVMTAFKAFVTRSKIDAKQILSDSKIRCIRVADRVTKAIHIDRFCK